MRLPFHEPGTSNPVVSSCAQYTDEALLSTAEIKRLLGVSGMTIWRWRKAGLIPEPYSIRGRNYWRRQEFFGALARLTKSTDAEYECVSDTQLAIPVDGDGFSDSFPKCE